MKKLFALVAVTAMLITTLPGCLDLVHGSGVLLTEEYDFADFTRLEISHTFEVDVVESDFFSVSVTIDDNLSQHLRVSRSGSLLRIGLNSGTSFSSATAFARVEMPSLSSITLSGASRGTVIGFQPSEDIEFNLSGASNLRLEDIAAGDVSLELSGASSLTGDLVAEDIELEISGASRVDLTGSARDTLIRASGASRVDVSDISVRNADVRLSGASQATVQTNGQLDVDISGASRLEYMGQPTLGELDISEASTLSRR